jgi:carboxylesterase type B
MMRALCLLSSLIGAGILADAQSDPVPNSELAVRTTSGTYSGFVNSTTPDVNIWLGIPFGTPPVGARRFLKAEKAPDYGVANATAYKPICFQDNNRTTGVFWTLVPEFQNTDTEDEDCLYLNIWAPRKPLGAKKVPVIIWVFGGGFREGGGHAPYQVPDQWSMRRQLRSLVDGSRL